MTRDENIELQLLVAEQAIQDILEGLENRTGMRIKDVAYDEENGLTITLDTEPSQ